MKAKHTPGPWTSRQVTGTCATRIYGGGQQGTKECRLVCEILYREGDPTERHANARLIAAAPRLLDELRNLVFRFEHCEAPEDREALDAAQAAIDEATGAK